MQHKNITLDEVQVKFDTVAGMKFSGYASVFNSVDSYGDTILKGAYAKTLVGRKRDIRMRWNHYGEVIGKWVRVEEDEKGLYVEGELTPNHSKAEDVYALMKHGAVDGLSIGFILKDFEMKDDVRVLKEIDLIEISVVEDPADLGAKIGDVKSAINEAKTLKEFETLLRDAGKFSRSDATAIVSRIKSLGEPSDLEPKDEEQKMALAVMLKLKTFDIKE